MGVLLVEVWLAFVLVDALVGFERVIGDLAGIGLVIIGLVGFERVVGDLVGNEVVVVALVGFEATVCDFVDFESVVGDLVVVAAVVGTVPMVDAVAEVGTTALHVVDAVVGAAHVREVAVEATDTVGAVVFALDLVVLDVVFDASRVAGALVVIGAMVEAGTAASRDVADNAAAMADAIVVGVPMVGTAALHDAVVGAVAEVKVVFGAARLICGVVNDVANAGTAAPREVVVVTTMVGIVIGSVFVFCTTALHDAVGSAVAAINTVSDAAGLVVDVAEAGTVVLSDVAVDDAGMVDAVAGAVSVVDIAVLFGAVLGVFGEVNFVFVVAGVVCGVVDDVVGADTKVVVGAAHVQAVVVDVAFDATAMVEAVIGVVLEVGVDLTGAVMVVVLAEAGVGDAAEVVLVALTVTVPTTKKVRKLSLILHIYEFPNVLMYCLQRCGRNYHSRMGIISISSKYNLAVY